MSTQLRINFIEAFKIANSLFDPSYTPAIQAGIRNLIGKLVLDKANFRTGKLIGHQPFVNHFHELPVSLKLTLALAAEANWRRTNEAYGLPMGFKEDLPMSLTLSNKFRLKDLRTLCRLVQHEMEGGPVTFRVDIRQITPAQHRRFDNGLLTLLKNTDKQMIHNNGLVPFYGEDKYFDTAIRASIEHTGVVELYDTISERCRVNNKPSTHFLAKALMVKYGIVPIKASVEKTLATYEEVLSVYPKARSEVVKTILANAYKGDAYKAAVVASKLKGVSLRTLFSLPEYREAAIHFVLTSCRPEHDPVTGEFNAVIDTNRHGFMFEDEVEVAYSASVAWDIHNDATNLGLKIMAPFGYEKFTVKDLLDIKMGLEGYVFFDKKVQSIEV